MVVVVMVMVMIQILTLQMIFDPGFLAKATSNRVQNLYLSRLLLPY